MFKISKTWQAWDNIMNFLTALTTGDDKGISVVGGQFSVGEKGNGNESVFGEGDSFPVDIAFHYNVANESGTTITSATDITSILQSDTGSTVSMFENNLAGEIIMIGNDTPPGGVKSKWASLGTLEPDRLVGEYLNNLDTWLPNTYGVVDANYPHTRYGWNIASVLNEQLRFGLSIVNPNLDFELRTLNINGVDYTKYWVRLRLVTPVTALPVLEQVKAHTNRTEINSSGIIEFFGLARGIKNVEVLETANQASDPANENVTYYTGGLNGGVSKLVDNEFSSTALDSKCYLIKIDENVDTSTPVLLSIPYYVKGTGIGDIDFFAEITQITSDFKYGTIVTPDENIENKVTVAANVDLERQILQFEIPINKLDGVAGVLVVVSRDSRGTNPNDTLGNSVILTGSTGDARRWRL